MGKQRFACTLVNKSLQRTKIMLLSQYLNEKSDKNKYQSYKSKRRQKTMEGGVSLPGVAFWSRGQE